MPVVQRICMHCFFRTWLDCMHYLSLVECSACISTLLQALLDFTASFSARAAAAWQIRLLHTAGHLAAGGLHDRYNAENPSCIHKHKHTHTLPVYLSVCLSVCCCLCLSGCVLRVDRTRPELWLKASESLKASYCSTLRPHTALRSHTLVAEDPIQL